MNRNERFWSGQRDAIQNQIEGHRDLAVTAERVVSEGQALAADAAAKAAAAKDKVERIKAGEDVPVERPFTYEEMDRILREMGVDPRHCARVAEVCEAFGFKAMMEFIWEARERAERAAVRALRRRIPRE